MNNEELNRDRELAREAILRGTFEPDDYSDREEEEELIRIWKEEKAKEEAHRGLRLVKG